VAVGFLYQRHSLNNFTGVALSKHLGVPLVVEYNGSETWMHAHWDRPLKHEVLSGEIEQLNLATADLVVVVSEAMRAELVARGIAPEAVLTNPNGVDPDMYSPRVDGSDVRRRFGLDGKVVVGFIGTFGPWHGAEVLATAFARLVERRPDLASSVRLLMIGDGPTMPETRRRIRDGGVEPLTVFAGRTAQADGPAHLAACDVLVSPHVPNPDGTPFFGSPTKLFEYMAMGKPIVASDLDQIGEVLDHGETAWLVQPGDPDDLAAGIAILIDDPERAARLGRAARERAVSRHTWRAHTERIVEALRERCS
jgi:glycosyltransferase involved in cell wall biosynthesis